MQQPVELAYANAPVSHGHRVFAAFAIMVGGVALAVLGGCFLIGVMLTATHGFFSATSPVVLTSSAITLIVVLYVLAAIAFICAALVFLIGLRALLSITRG